MDLKKYSFSERFSEIALDELKDFKRYLEEKTEKLYPKQEVLSSRLDKYQKLRDQKFLRLMFSKSKKYKKYVSILERGENIGDKTRKRLDLTKTEINSLEETKLNLENYFGI